jgi:hypothetical protein
MDEVHKKLFGAYYTPESVVRSLVSWVVRKDTDRLLDPACGDGRFIAAHTNSMGIDQDSDAVRAGHEIAPDAMIHHGDFFKWASQTSERFECAAGNPPFIRYQRFNGEVRKTALGLCAEHGVKFSALSSSWAPFIVASAALLKPGGRMGFVVPAEIGHASYSNPVLDYLTGHFETVHIIAVEHKLFPELSEDCWLLYADGFSGKTNGISLSKMSRFEFMKRPPVAGERIPVDEWKKWNCRLRAFLLPSEVRALYKKDYDRADTVCMKDVARVGIGYVTGDNNFFHLRPSEAQYIRIPEALLHPTVRNGKALNGGAITRDNIDNWRQRDEPNFLLRIRPGENIPRAVRRYLDSAAGQKARNTYKCRNRDPWYAVPDVVVPNAFLSYMSNESPRFVANHSGCTGTNSVLMVALNGGMKITELQDRWENPLTRLSCEIEGHPLGGGMLKLEPREAGRVLLDGKVSRSRKELQMIAEGIMLMRQWRHCA